MSGLCNVYPFLECRKSSLDLLTSTASVLLRAMSDPHTSSSLHVNGDDFGLDGGLSPDIEKSDVFDRTGHPCRLDFERFGAQIGLTDARIKRVLDKYMQVPELTTKLVGNSFLNDKMKRKYLRIVDERVKRFVRKSE